VFVCVSLYGRVGGCWHLYLCVCVCVCFFVWEGGWVLVDAWMRDDA